MANTLPSPNANSSLHFPSTLLHFQNLCPAFSYLRKRKKKKRAGSTRGHVTELPLRFSAGFFQATLFSGMCNKSTSVTEQTLYLLRIQTAPCISLQPFFIFKTFVPLFPFCGYAKGKSEHKKFWKRIGGAGGKERTFFKRFFLSPAGKVPLRRTTASVTVGCRFATAWQARFRIPCAPNPPMLPSKHSTISEYKQILAFPHALLHFQNLCPAFSYLRKRKKKKRT